MNSSKIGQNEPCPCGSGKKYKKCCWGKEIENNQVFEPRDADQIIVTHLIGLIVKYPALITTKDGKTLSGRKELKCSMPHAFEFLIPEEKNELEKMLSIWDLGYKNADAEEFLSLFDANKLRITFEGKEFSRSTIGQIERDGTLFDSHDNPISDHVSVKILGKATCTCESNLGLEISFVKKGTEEGVLLSKLLNIIPNSLSKFNAAFLLDAVNFFLSDSLHKNYEFLEKNSFNPDEKINSSLKAIANYYYKSKNTRDPEKKECERFASETLDNNDHFGKLWWKTWEVQLDMLIDKEKISNGQRDALVNEWLVKIVLPKDYGKEENDLRFEAACAWFWDEVKRNQISLKQVRKESLIGLPIRVKMLMKNRLISYMYMGKDGIVFGRHARFSNRERQILIEVFRNPENFMTYFRNLLLTDMPEFNIVPAYYLDNLFWNSSADFSKEELKRPISFMLSKARMPFLNSGDAEKINESLYDYGMRGFRDLLGLTFTPKGIFSQAGIHNPKLDGNIDDFMSFYHDKNPAMIGNFEEINRIYGSNSILNSTENSFRFYFGGKFASENDQLIKSHLEVVEEYRGLRTSRVS